MRTPGPLAAIGLIGLTLAATPLVGPPVFAAVTSQGTEAATGAAPPVSAAEPPADLFPDWLPSGGLYGREKWVPGSNGVDVFLPRGTEIRAPVAGLVVAPASMVQPAPPPVPAVALRGDNGLSFYMGHVRALVPAGARVAAGALLAVIDDPALDRLGSDGPGPSGWQHVDLNVSLQGRFTWYGGDVPASPWLQQTGYEGTLVDRTPAPPAPR